MRAPDHVDASLSLRTKRSRLVKRAGSAPCDTLVFRPIAAVPSDFSDTLASMTKHSCRAFAGLGLAQDPATDRYSVKPVARNASAWSRQAHMRMTMPSRSVQTA